MATEPRSTTAPGCRRRADAAAPSSRGRDLGGRGPKRRVLRLLGCRVLDCEREPIGAVDAKHSPGLRYLKNPRLVTDDPTMHGKRYRLLTQEEARTALGRARPGRRRRGRRGPSPCASRAARTVPRPTGRAAHAPPRGAEEANGTASITRRGAGAAKRARLESRGGYAPLVGSNHTLSGSLTSLVGRLLQLPVLVEGFSKRLGCSRALCRPLELGVSRSECLQWGIGCAVQ